MSDAKWNPSDWNPLDGLWGAGGPNPMAGTSDFRWINDYVDNIVNDALSQTGGRRPVPGKLPVELFQTHHYVIARFRVPDSVKAHKLRVFASATKLRLEGLPKDGKQVVALPSAVRSDSAKALYKEGILQIKLLKKRMHERYEEVFVRFE
ncbi:Hsp20/alpha crystallin family protein [Paenibacillus sp. TRM 82003]|nr:Hsp20/alpha crystallin family protein [Paenibacillus sp. TRM 82003]